MGTWGSGLYASDMASDIRALVKSVLRLPISEARIVEILCEAEPTAAHDSNSPDHTTFWLAIADQLVRAGQACPDAFSKAISIIDSGADLGVCQARGLAGAKLDKRAAMLQELRARLIDAPTSSKPRKTLKEPQPFLFELGTLYTLPCRGAACINPGRGRKTLAGSAWAHDGYRQFIVLERGRAFDYLAWYQAIVSIAALPGKPAFAGANADLWWQLEMPKTCSQKTFDAIEIAPLGKLPIDFAKACARFPKRRAGQTFLGWGGRGAAIHDAELTDWFVQAIPDRTAALAKGQSPQEGPLLMRNLDEILVN